jgi:hypothetical protein
MFCAISLTITLLLISGRLACFLMMFFSTLFSFDLQQIGGGGHVTEVSQP